MSNKLHDYLKKNADAAYDLFADEIATDENKDYRRGFRAGVLYSYLQIQADLTEISHQKTVLSE